MTVARFLVVSSHPLPWRGGFGVLDESWEKQSSVSETRATNMERCPYLYSAFSFQLSVPHACPLLSTIVHIVHFVHELF